MDVSTLHPPQANPLPRPSGVVEAIAQHIMEKNMAPKLVEGHVQAQPVGVHLDAAAIQKAIEDIQHQFDLKNHKLEYSLHEETNKVVVRITDRQSGQVIREVPDAEFLDLVSRLKDLVGFVINTKV